MLRLTRIAGTHPTQAIKLEGKLLGPWVDEVSKACAAGTAATVASPPTSTITPATIPSRMAHLPVTKALHKAT